MPELLPERHLPSGHPVVRRPVERVGLGCLLLCFLSLLRLRVDSRSPKTVPRVWSVSCWRQRASSPSPANVTGSPSRPVPVDRREVGPGALDERAREGQAALVAVVEPAVPALGQGEHRVADDARPCARPTRRGSRRRTPPGPRRSGRRPGRPVGGVHRGDHVGDQRAQRVVVRRDRRLRAVHHRRAPAGDRADRAALGERAVRRVDGLVGHGGHAERERRACDPARTPDRVVALVCNSELHLPHVHLTSRASGPAAGTGWPSTETRDPIGYRRRRAQPPRPERPPRPARAAQADRAGRLHRDPQRLQGDRHREPHVRQGRASAARPASGCPPRPPPASST